MKPIVQTNRTIVEYFKVRSKNITTTFQVGGEIKGLSKLTSDVREELLVEIK